MTKNLTAFIAGVVCSAAPCGAVTPMTVNTAGNQSITSKEVYINAEYTLGDMTTPAATEIRGRGNYTWLGFAKKPYKLKLAKKTELPGLDKNKHFALLAHADDRTGFLRNTIGFELSRLMGLAWTPSQLPVELTLNGSYEGLYMLTETIRVDKTRVDIVEQPDSATAPAEITGGWLVEIDNYDSDPHITVTEGGGTDYPIWFTYKTPELLSPEQESWLTDQMTRLNALIYADDKTDASALEAMLDLDAFARFYLVQEITDNTESFHGSCYLHRQQGDDSRWTFGPVWDFGNAFMRNKDGRTIWEGGVFHQVWVGELLKFPAVRGRVEQVWHEFATSGAIDRLFAAIDEFERTIRPAMAANYARWPEYMPEDYAGAWSNCASTLRTNLMQVGRMYGTEPPLAHEVYLRGTFNNWSTSDPFTYEGDGIYTITDINPGDSFKIATSDWSAVDYGSPVDGPVELPINQPFILTERGFNIRPTVVPGNVDMRFDLRAATLTLYMAGGADDIVADTADSPAEYFTIQGVRASGTAPGLYIVRRGARVFKMLVK